MTTEPAFPWRALNAAWLVGLTAALLLGASIVWRDQARDTEERAQQIHRLVSAGLELGRGSPQRLQALLAAVPAPPLFSGLEIHGKTGRLAAVRYGSPLPGSLERWLPASRASAPEFPLDARGSLVLRLVPAPPYAWLLQAAPPALAVVVFAVVFANLTAWLLRGRRYRASISASLYAEALAPGPAEGPRAQSAPGGAAAWFDDFAIALLHCDADGRVVHLNQAACALLGRTPIPAQPLSLADLIAPWERAGVGEFLVRGGRPGGGTTLETQVLAARGEILPATFRTATRPNERGERLVLLQDASAKKHLYDELTLRNRLLDTLPFGLAMLKTAHRGEIVYCNEAFRSLLHLPAPASDHRPVRLVDHLAAELTEAVTEPLRLLMGKPEATVIQYPWGIGEDHHRTLELRLMPIRLAPRAETLLVCVAEDRTEQTAFRQRTEQELTRCRKILQEMPLALCLADQQGRVRAINTALRKLTGRPAEQLIDLPLGEWLSCDPASPIARGNYAIRNTDRVAALSMLDWASPSGGHEYVYFLDDVTSFRKQAELDRAELERLQLTLDGIAEGVITTNTGAFIQYINPYGQKLTGLLDEQYKGLLLGHVVRLVDETNREPIADPAIRAMRVGKTVRFRNDIVLLRENRPELAVEIAATPLQDAKSRVVGCVIVLREVSEQRSLTRQMAMRATRDPLTGLVNRRELLSRLQTLQSEVEEYHRECWLCYMDLDRFKIVNDSCGHQAGDELLRQIAQSMQDGLRANDILARIGGDEFCVVLCDTTLDNALVAAERIREAVKRFRFAWEGKYFDVGVSIGVSRLLSGISVEEAITAADQACYTAKEKGRNLVHVASAPEPIAETPHTGSWSGRLSKAMEHDYFRLLRYDARLLADSGGPVPAYHEIVPQLQEPGETPIAAAVFLPRAQRLNLVPAIERYVLGKLFSMMPPGSPSASEVYAIQLSPATLAEAGLTRYLCSQSELYAVSPQRICFEVSEDDVVANFTLYQKFMRESREAGFRFCLSHFGGGISSFSNVRNLPVSFLKIDSSLTRRVETDPVDEGIIRAIQDFGERMNFLIIAQHVDSEGTLDTLRRLGLHYAQGPIVAKPVLLS